MAALQRKSTSSCSPLPTRPTNRRNSEICNPMRRSFSGSPFAKPSIVPNQRTGFNPNTPANSPSDHPRRNSIGRESLVVCFRDSEHKENAKDEKSKLCSVGSPASSKGTKNFMSQTISAASKINASPRKKILEERNESVCASVYLSKGNGLLKEDLDFKPEKGLKQKKEVSFNPTITYLENKEEETLNGNEGLDSVVNSHNTTDDCYSFSGSAAGENDFANLDPTFKISPRTSSSFPSPAMASEALETDFVILDPSFRISPRISSSLPSPTLASLDADPSVPPCDLKTNYLSPKPQFLHYKPNPRVKLYLKQRDAKQILESFVSECTSDEEVIAQETISGESSLDSHKEYLDAASSDVVTKEEEEEEEELIVSEPKPITTFEEAIEARKVDKRHFLTRPKFTALLFVLALAGFWASVSHLPIMDPSELNNLNLPNLYVPPEISEFSRENLEGLVQKFRLWLYDSLSCIRDLVISFRGWHKLGGLQFVNLTMLLKDSSVDDYHLVEHSNFVAEVMNERRGEVDVQTSEEEGDQPLEGDEKVGQGPEIQSIQKEDEEGDEFIEEVAEERFTNEAGESNEEVADDKGEDPEYQEAIAVPDSFEALGVVITPESEEDSMVVQTDKATELDSLATEETQERVNIAENTTALPSNADIAEHSVAIRNAETEPEVSSFRQSLAENMVSPAETGSTMEEFKPKSLELYSATMEQQIAGSVHMSVHGIKDLILSRQAMMGAFFTALILIAVIPFAYVKIRTSSAPDAAITADQLLITKNVDHSPLSAAITGNTFQEKSFSRQWQEVETIRESCPSEMTSFVESSSKHERGDTAEAQSQEKRRSRSSNGRESTASSDCSMVSASYGSFTTPVRRSSRIRNQITSP